jgi:hypothetical protein
MSGVAPEPQPNPAMTVFLAECYAPASGTDDPAAAPGRVAGTCRALRESGAAIDYLGALIVPGDELAYHIFSAPDADVVTEAGSRAGLAVERVVPAQLVGMGRRAASARQALSIAVEADRAVGHAADEIGP